MVTEPELGALADVVETLRTVEERLRDAAYDRLRDAVDGDEAAVASERRIQQARRAVVRALKALGSEPDL